MDPLDGSSNIDNVSVGTIFSVYRRVTPIGTQLLLKIFYNRNQSGCCGICNLRNFYDVSLYYWSWVNGFTLNPAIGLLFIAS
jgi:fructose-1,6-bisphosphatase I